MQKLSQLTTRIKKWNMMGHSLLPPLDLVIITGSAFQAQTNSIIQMFQSTQIKIARQKSMDLSIEEKGKPSQKQQVMKQQQKMVQKQQSWTHNTEQLFVMKDSFYGKMHVIKGLSDGQIRDQQFKERKKIIEKYRRQKYIIFIVFTQEDKKQLLKNQDHLIQFGLQRSFDGVIFYDKTYNVSRVIHEILRKYQNSFKFDLVTNYRLMRDIKKESQKQTKRYMEWKKVMSKQINPVTFSLLSLRMYIQSMKSSFSGTYSNSSHYEQLGIGKSINWKVMQLLHAFWQVQSDILFKQVDSFPLSYIEQQYKMSDHYSVGGFLPDTCFKAIFSPPLYQFRNSLMSTIQNIKQSVLRHIQLALNYTFQNTNIKQTLIGKQLENIEQICDKFIEDLSNSLESQIEFIHANPQDFWNYRQLNSSFYSPDQQVYIQIKYIGKAYVRKVHESIKDAVPRFIGQGLLKRIVRHLSQQSINTFIQITKKEQFQIKLTQSQITKYESGMEILKQLDSLITYFSLRVNSSFLIKNFHQKKQKEWDRMFGRSQKIVIQQRDNQYQQKTGIINWMKKIFKRNKNNQVRRASSGEKKVEVVADKQELKSQKNIEKKAQAINQKNWLLIINTGRQVSHQRIKLSSLQGFSSKFRSSIWMYLATKGKPKGTKLKTLLKQQPNADTLKQIQKDIPRTSPRQLFQYSMKASLRNVLVGYSLYDKQISYTQGMNFITAVILTTLINYGQKSSPLIDNRINYQQTQEKAFCILKHIMEDCGVRKLMMVQASMLADLSLRLNDRIKQLSPKMSQLISSTPFSCQMIFSSPLISCLSNVTNNLAIMKRFLDVLITHDFLIVYRIIAQFVAHCEYISAKIHSENIYDFLKNKMYDEIYAIVGEEGLTKIFNQL